MVSDLGEAEGERGIFGGFYWNLVGVVEVLEGKLPLD
jgi:hypothetical protein